MAFGENYNNNDNGGKRGEFRVTVYSPYKMNHGMSEVDQTCMSFQMWSGSLKIGIHPRRQNTNNDMVTFDMQGGITIYMNHTKARMFHTIIKKFREDPEAYNEAGVPSGAGLITINNGKAYDSKHPCIVIRNLDPNTGAVNAEFIYELKGDDYYYGISNFNPENSAFTKNFEDFADIELDQIETMLEQYYNAMTYATAYSVIDANRFEMTHLNGKIESIGAKLGVEFGRNNGSEGNKFSNKSYFANSEAGNASSFTPSSLADLDDDLPV